jgi:Abnormal spindle-like microcephaly-assoc'd, ASPM-SPD-2-Hydin/CARDB
MATIYRSVHHARTKQNLFRAATLIAAAATVCIALLGLARAGAAQTPSLPNVLNIQPFGISIRYPDGWSVAPKRYDNLDELINVPADQQGIAAETARLKIRVQSRTDHNEALQELQDIVNEVSSPSTFLAIGGWPAMQRWYVDNRQQPSTGPRNIDPWILRTTTAVAAGSLLVRVEGALPSDADPALVDLVGAIGRSLGFALSGDPGVTQQELQSLTNGPQTGALFTPVPSAGAPIFFSAPSSLGGGPGEEDQSGVTLPTTPGPPEISASSPGLTQRLFASNNGELEIAASPNGQNIVFARQNNWRSSNDGGQTFPFAGNINLGDGDPSLAFGQSGNFYLAGISINCLPPDGTGPNGYDCTGIMRSTDNGQTFPFLSNAVACPKDNPSPPPNLPNRCFPDQEHIAADRVNPGGGGDQVYSTWRNFDATDQDPAIVCSQNSGATWTAPLDVDSGFIPRIGTGQDGFVYVVYRSGGNIRINKYSSCATGLVQQPTFPKTINTVADVTCPVPGLDRCNDGNNLSSIMVAVDDTNPNHVYVTYAHETGAGNQDIRVQDSLDGGVTWPGGRLVTVNTTVPGVRFMPWVCSTGGDAFVTWYDRRSATPCPSPPCAARNDLTDFYAGSAGLDSGGNLTALSEFKVTTASDPQCGLGTGFWPCAPRATGDSESCSAQPQLAGVCCTGFDASGNCLGSGNRCDFSTPTACLGGETCNGGGGCPKYGDYNGNACVAGRLLVGWASAVPPPGIASSGGIDAFFAQFLLSDVPQIQVPGDLAFGNACLAGTVRQTLEVCNTGNANLSVASITSSDPQFVVSTPSAGYPVVVSPDFCFPFQVRLTPTSAGAKSATLTITSDDPAHPTITVAATGTGGTGQVLVSPNPLTFGTVPVNPSGGEPGFADLPFKVHNQGTCDLKIHNVSATGGNAADFTVLATVPGFDITLSPDADFFFTVRFDPSAPGPRSSTLRTVSDSGQTPGTFTTNTDVTVEGNTSGGAGSGAGLISANPGTLDFGLVSDTPSRDATLSVCNGGQVNLSISGITIAGTNAGDFVLNPPVPGFPVTITPDDCHDFTITFTPSEAGSRTAIAQIAHDAGNTASPLGVNLVGQRSAGPDFIGSWVSLTQTCKGSGPHLKCTLKGRFRVTNNGTGNGLGSKVVFFLSPDDSLEESDTRISTQNVNPLKAGNGKLVTWSRQLPNGTSASGSFVFAVLDSRSVVSEINETNNVIVFGPIP